MTKKKAIFITWLFLITALLLPQLSLSYAQTNPTLSSYKRPILLINLYIDRPNNIIEVRSLKKGVGFIPDYKSASVDFVSLEITKQDTSKINYFIPIPPAIIYSPPRPGQENTSPSYQPLDKFNHTIIIPYEENSTVKINKPFSAQNKTTIQKELSLTIPGISGKNSTISEGLRRKSLEIQTLVPPQADSFTVETFFDGNPANNDPSTTLDLLFISSGFGQSEFESFRNFTFTQTDGLLGIRDHPGKAPFPNHKNLIKARRVLTTEIFHDANGWIDWEKLNPFLAGLSIPFDQYAVVLNMDGRSGASYGGDFMMLYNGDNRLLLYAHELAHSFGAIMDEYIERWGESGDFYRELGKNCKEDPTENWINDLPGGAYLGCNYVWNNYRPEPLSIMSDLPDYAQFNEPTKYHLNQAFSAYTESAPILVLNNNLKYYFNLQKPAEHQRPSWTYFHKLGTYQGLNGQALVIPQVDWIVERQIDFSNANYINFNLDARGKTPGIYQTTLKITFFTTPQVVKEIPIKMVMEDTNATPTLTLIAPAQTSFQIGSVIPFSLNSNIQTPGWKRVEYYYKYPNEPPPITADGNLFYSKTVEPFDAVFDTNYETTPGIFNLLHEGAIEVWAKGYRFIEATTSSQRVTINLTCTDTTPPEKPEFDYAFCNVFGSNIKNCQISWNYILRDRGCAGDVKYLVKLEATSPPVTGNNCAQFTNGYNCWTSSNNSFLEEGFINNSNCPNKNCSFYLWAKDAKNNISEYDTVKVSLNNFGLGTNIITYSPWSTALVPSDCKIISTWMNDWRNPPPQYWHTRVEGWNYYYPYLYRIPKAYINCR